jgi:hypothetical protein
VNAPADAVRRLQDHQIRDPSVPQPLPRRDPCCKTSHCTTVYVTVIDKSYSNSYESMGYIYKSGWKELSIVR